MDSQPTTTPFPRHVLIIGSLVMVVLMAMFSLYLTAVRQAVIANEREELANMAAQTSLRISRQMESDFQTLQTLAKGLEWPPVGDITPQLNVLRETVDTHGYKAMGLAFEDGLAISTNAEELDLSDRTYIRKAFDGLTLISRPLLDKVDGQTINVYATPVVREGRTVAVLFVALPTDYFARLLVTPNSNSSERLYVVHRDGTKTFWINSLVPSQESNVFDGLEDRATDMEPSLAVMQSNMREGRSGFMSYRIDGQLCYMSYTPLKNSDWYLLSVVPNSVIQNKATVYVTMTLTLVAGLFAVVMGLFWYIYRTDVRNRRIVTEKVRELSLLTSSIPGGVVQCHLDPVLTIDYVNDEFCNMVGYNRAEFLSVVDNSFARIIDDEDISLVLETLQHIIPDTPHKDLEYRIIHRNGQRIWVKERVQMMPASGKHKLCGVILSIQAEKQAEQRIRFDAERYRLLFELSDSILFELDMATGIIGHSKKYTDLFGDDLVQANFPQSAIDKGRIHPEDINAFMDFFERLYGGAEFVEQEMRLANREGGYTWCNVYATTIFDPAQISSKVIGRIDIIDTQKRQIEELKTTNELDPFTRLYNKVSTIRHVQAALSSPNCEPAAFFIIDIDNFKRINDAFGHDMGDEVILGIAHQLRRTFRADDIIGRIGGDEFFVLARNIRNVDSFLNKLPMITSRVCHVIQQNGGVERRVTTSFGMALFPTHGTTWEDLYKNADKALYHTKEIKGKNGVSTYFEVLRREGVNQA